ncbi:hypothetical protein Glove_132g209 [Diversispora epigaea]|uniref:Protein kinase domain-containing protein n=1 Tax=Diversispora epigaea TaxID=1348612 RepID=A0A397IXR5_9GLOM|nr:hypothetical protein Glove_132g209 [Diversispora epigaea]
MKNMQEMISSWMMIKQQVILKQIILMNFKFDLRTFWDICNRHANTIVALKLKERAKFLAYAEWIDMLEELFGFYNSNKVALKKLKNSQQIIPEFLKETLPWKERLWLLNSFIRGLKTIHIKGFIHRDLHPGNLMITEAHDRSKFIRLGDLGLCRPANEISSSGTYGVLPHIAPEVMNKNQCTQASDIYSVGIIMWIVSTGIMPFEGELYNSEQAIAIFNGYRQKIKKGTPQCYVKLMEECWKNDPSERPSAETILIILENWIYDLIYFEKSEDALMFLNAYQEMQNIDSESLHNETSWSKIHLISKPLMQHNLAICESFSKCDIKNSINKFNKLN